MIQVWRSPLEQHEGRISGLCIKSKLDTHTMSTEGTGATTQLCLSPGFVWSRPCICRRNAPPSCWTWRSSRWCSRCRRRRCRPCVGCTWPAYLSCESQKWVASVTVFAEAPAAPLAACSQKIQQKPGRFSGGEREFGFGMRGGKWKRKLMKGVTGRLLKFPVWLLRCRQKRFLCASHAGKVRPCLMPHSHICKHKPPTVSSTEESPGQSDLVGDFS